MEQLRRLAREVLGEEFESDPRFKDFARRLQAGGPSFLIEEDLRAIQRRQKRERDGGEPIPPPYHHGGW